MKKPVVLGLTDDAALIERSRTEPEAFAAIFDRHATEIHRYAARRLGAALAEDVVGETFLVAFRRRDSYDLAYRDARPWLFGIRAFSAKYFFGSTSSLGAVSSAWSVEIILI